MFVWSCLVLVTTLQGTTTVAAAAEGSTSGPGKTEDPHHHLSAIFARIKDVKHDCAEFDPSEWESAKDIVKIVSCDEPGAVFDYSLKVI